MLLHVAGGKRAIKVIGDDGHPGPYGVCSYRNSFFHLDAPLASQQLLHQAAFLALEGFSQLA